MMLNFEPFEIFVHEEYFGSIWIPLKIDVGKLTLKYDVAAELFAKPYNTRYRFILMCYCFAVELLEERKLEFDDIAPVALGIIEEGIDSIKPSASLYTKSAYLPNMWKITMHVLVTILDCYSLLRIIHSDCIFVSKTDRWI